ncbi:MAG: protein-tyrosine phosphatase-like protein [Monoraphidium minutum]|nr:MAG: protein-tyrosine phosphatase-like protein [Monoraphidium minutum]
MDDFEQAVEIIPGLYSLAVLKAGPSLLSRLPVVPGALVYCIDHELLYEPFYSDFGPLNLGRTFRFCEKTARLLQARREAEQRGKRLVLCCGPQPQQRANAAVLVGAFRVMLMGHGADAAYAPLAALEPFMPFRDASCGTPCFHLRVQDCLRGLERAVAAGFLDASGGAWRFDIDEYEHYEQVENGDLNWIVPGKLAAFSGPAPHPHVYVGFRAMVPEDYVDYYRRRRVTAVVRLNKKVYERKRFLDGGLRHHELYFPDGSNPPTELLLRFMELAEQEPGALAIHCKAGLGRTGVLICSYMMKHYRFTAEEAIGYIRICRPGSVIGPQQNYLQEVQPLMWREGDARRAALGAAPPPPAWGPAAPGRAAALRAASLPPGAAAAAAAAGGKARKAGGNPVVSLVIDATGDAGSRGGSSAGGAGGGGAAPARPAGSPLGGGGGGTLQGLLSVLGSVGSMGAIGSPLSSALMMARPAGGQLAGGRATAVAAARPPAPPALSSFSAEGLLAAWRSGGDVAAPVAGAGAPRPKSGVVHVLAPNGQPRKMPAAGLQGGAADAGYEIEY